MLQLNYLYIADGMWRTMFFQPFGVSQICIIEEKSPVHESH